MNFRAIAVSALLLAAPNLSHAASERPDVHVATGVDWYQGGVDAAFRLAKKSNKPLFLYWGAVWCPPCNQVKATVFNSQGFIKRSRFFVPVHLDGDRPGAQKLGARFKVRGYPTMILFRPNGTEITRLPGEVDRLRYLQVLELGMIAGRSVKDTLRIALSDGANLTADDWRLLAYYSWDTDEQQLVGAKNLALTLQHLGSTCPPGDPCTHLKLNALVVAATVPRGEAPAVDKAASTALVMYVLNDARISRDNMDILTNYAAEIVEFISEPKSATRAQLTVAWNNALQRLANDTTLSKADRLSAIDSKVALARLDTPDGPFAPALLHEVRQRIAQADRATKDIYERQSVISTAAHTLSDAGLLDESDALLKAELKRSRSPYYFMLSLAANAKKRHDTTTALNWYEQAYQTAEGPATRLQWGSTYLGELLELAPSDENRIEKAANRVIRELGETENAFYERNSGALEKLGRKFALWNASGQHDSAFQRLENQFNAICAKLPANDPQRTTCQQVFDSAQS